MADDRTARDDLERLQQAVSREVARRRGRLRVYTALLVVPLVLMVTVLLFGRSDAERTVTAVASSLPRDTTFVANVTRSPELQKAIDSAAQTAAVSWVEERPDAVADALVATEAFRSSVAPAAEQAVRGTMDDPAFVRELGSRVAATESFAELRREVVRQAESAAERRTGAALGEVRQQLGSVRELAMTAAEDRPRRDELAALTRRVNEMSARLDGLEAATRRLTGSVDRIEEMAPAAVPRSFVVKEGRVTELPGTGLTVALGRRVEAGITRVEVRAGRQVLLAEGGEREPVGFGRPLRFVGPDRVLYELTLGFTLNRRLARDYIGVELTPVE